MKSIKDCFKMIVTAVTCFVMNIVPEKNTDMEKNVVAEKNRNKNVNTGTGRNVVSERNLFAQLFMWMENMGIRLIGTSPRAKFIAAYIIKDTESKKKNFQTDTNSKEHRDKGKIIYWDEPRIQRRINKFAYFHTG